MSSFTTKELRDVLTPIHSRIDDFINRAIEKGLSNISVDDIKELIKCDTELREFEIDMSARVMIERSKNKKESK